VICRSIFLSALLGILRWCDAAPPQITFLHVSIGSDGRAQIVMPQGKKIPVPRERGQVDIAASQTADDGKTVGWLVEYSDPGISDPVSGMLVIWRNGRVIRRFRADSALWSWSFDAGGNQVAYHDGPLHGEATSHFELRDIASGRLLDQWNGEISDTSKRPAWVAGLTR
jgi:hypothetical protein